MKIINQNPYRIIGVVANASTREIQARKGKIQAFSRIGKEVESEYDFSFLEPVHRTEEQINKAFSDIEQNLDKVKYALFWFINHSAIDNIAIGHLKNGDIDKACEIWCKVINNQEINAKNFSAYNNIATVGLCYMLENNIDDYLAPRVFDINKLSEEERKKGFETFKNIFDKVSKLKGSKATFSDVVEHFKNQIGEEATDFNYDAIAKFYQEFTGEKISAGEYAKVYKEHFSKKSLFLKEGSADAKDLGKWHQYRSYDIIAMKVNLISSDYFKDFVHLVADETFNTDSNRFIEIFIDEILAQQKLNSSYSKILGIFKKVEGYAKTYLTKKITEEPIHTIETAIEKCKEDRNKDTNAYNIGVNFYNDTKEPLNNLKSILGEEHLQYQTFADSIASELLQCMIVYFNSNSAPDKDLVNTIIRYVKTAQNIAIGKNIKQRCIDNLNTLNNIIKNLENSKYNDCFQLVELLEEIKHKYQNQGLQFVYDDVEGDEFSSRSSFGRMVDNGYVDDNKVKKLLKKILTDEIIKKIAQSNNKDLIERYLSVTEFLFDKYKVDFFVQSRLDIFLQNIPSNSQYYSKVSIYKEKIKPTASDVMDKVVEHPVGGCLIVLIILYIIALIINFITHY